MSKFKIIDIFVLCKSIKNVLDKNHKLNNKSNLVPTNNDFEKILNQWDLDKKSPGNFEELINKQIVTYLKSYTHSLCKITFDNYQNAINNFLKEYTVNEINLALPSYYSELIPQIQKYAKDIEELGECECISFRAAKKQISSYNIIIEGIEKIYQQVKDVSNSLKELKIKNDKKKRKDRTIQIGLPVISIVAGIVIGIIGWII